MSCNFCKEQCNCPSGNPPCSFCTDHSECSTCHCICCQDVLDEHCGLCPDCFGKEADSGTAGEIVVKLTYDNDD